MLSLLILGQISAAALPQVTLEEALRRATALDPSYVGAMGQVESAEWARRAARLAFVIPSLTASLDATRYDTAFFNLGTNRLQRTAVTGRLDASYELFSLRKISQLARTQAGVDSAEAGQLKAKFQVALQTESDYYAVLTAQELTRVAADRARRAAEQLEVARARVVSGAAVQTDSLQLVLELTRARTDQIRQDAVLRVSRLQLGRRIGEPGPVDAVPLDTVPASPLPFGVEEAVQMALQQGPDYRIAVANERVASAVLRGQRGSYFPRFTLSAAHARFDTKFFPDAFAVNSITLNFSIPIWNNGDRELAVAQARANRDVARAIRDDLQRAALPDVTEAYEAYNTARAALELSQTALQAAQETFRVQQTRYRAGATTILDLIDAQLNLSQAQGDLVQSRYAVRLALAGLEAILGVRLFQQP
jgi:outer membrane protein TolC